ncbi:MAG TPA: hypothetical protein VKH82_07745, partial [Candidatus Binatia bacterium]|nr:hypothetical protein [Candidatus Binatia bacterium]
QLPFYVTRLRATVEGAPAGASLVYRWMLPAKAKGLLAADLNLTPGGSTSSIAGMCAEFGNACVLTADKQRFYNEPTIFFVAPTCDVLPTKPAKQFQGGTSKVKLSVSAGKRKLGKATITVGWGRNGAVMLSVLDVQGAFEDGIGKPNGVNVYAVTVAGANITQQPNPAPQGGIRTYAFGGGSAQGAETTSCTQFPQFAACAELVGLGAGRSFPTVEVRYVDGSSLCDNIAVRAGTCAPNPKLQVIAKPQRSTYDPANASTSTVDLTIRLKNASRREGNLPPCNFLLQGASVLSCMESLNVGGVKDTQTTQFDLQHCSQTTSQPCASNADCRSCGACVPGEVCLTQSHCSQTFTMPCSSNNDCESTGNNPPCPGCKPDETCIRVLQVPAGTGVTVPVGKSFDLFHQTVQMRNVLPDTAKVKDTWQANVFIPEVSAEKGLSYQVRGRPGTSP